MRTIKRASAAAAVALLALGLGACSEAEKAADDAQKKAGDKGSSLAADASEKADGMMSDGSGSAEVHGSDGAASEGSTDGSADGAVGGVSVDLGDYADDPAAKAVGEFYTARETVRGGGDSADLRAVTSADHLARALRWAKANPPAGGFQVVVSSVDGSTVNTCIGPDAKGARALTVEDGKVTANVAGDFTC